MKIYTGQNTSKLSLGSNRFVLPDFPGLGSPLLVQGLGFNAPTADPAPVGAWSNVNFDGKPMAHWDTVQWAEVPSSGKFYVGVTAFHKHGIDRVEFSLDNGPWFSVSGNFKLNPTTAVDGFIVEIPTTGLNFNLAGSSSADRSIEIRAIVYPNTAGSPRVLEPLILSEPISDRVVYVNSESGNDTTGTGASDLPYATVNQAIKKYSDANSADCRGLKIKLQAVSNPTTFPYELASVFISGASSGNSWVSIQADDGLTYSDVHVRHPAGLNVTANKIASIPQVEHVKLKNVTIKETRLYTSVNPATYKQWIWCEGCLWDHSYGDNEDYLTARGLTFVAGDNYAWSRTSFRDIGGQRRAFVTESRVEYSMQFPKDCQMIRNCSCKEILEDAIEGTKFCVNMKIDEIYDDVDLCTTSYHADVFTAAEYSNPNDKNTFADLENIIVFNCVAELADVQCLFLARSNKLYNMAFVNIFWTRPDNTSKWYELIGSQPSCLGEGSGSYGPPDNTTCKPWGNDSSGILLIGILNGTDHLVFQNCMLSDIVSNRLGGDFLVSGENLPTIPATNVVIDRCIVWEFYNDTANAAHIADWSGSHNHVLRFASAAEGQGIRGNQFFELSNTTYGNPGWANSSALLVYDNLSLNGATDSGWAYGTNQDFRPGSGSPLLVDPSDQNYRGVIKDVTGRLWYGTQTIGSLAQ